MHLILVSLFVFSFVGLQPDLPVLTESMLKSSGGRFVIQKDYTLLGKTLIMPSSTTLVFDGGSVNNGRLIGNHSFVEVNQTKPAFGIDIVIEGIWNTPEVHDGWFAFDKSPQFVSNQLINNILEVNDVHALQVDFSQLKKIPRKNAEAMQIILYFKDEDNYMYLLTTNNHPEDLKRIIKQLENK